MQVQKDEVREKILSIAEMEFFNKGFSGASMRVIAKKAHTTLGNLYNYFESKETILDAVMGEIPNKIEEMMEKHQKEAVIQEMPNQDELFQMEKLVPDIFEFEVLLGMPFIILMKGCTGTKYESYSKRFNEIVNKHIGEHLRKEDELMGQIISKSLVTALLSIGSSKVSLEQKKKTLARYIEIITLGILESQINKA